MESDFQIGDTVTINAPSRWAGSDGVVHGPARDLGNGPWHQVRRDIGGVVTVKATELQLKGG